MMSTAVLTLRLGGDVVIEDHAWIASRATILPGIRIGRGACGSLL